MLRNAEFTQRETVRACCPPLPGGPVVKPEMNTADRLGSSVGSCRAGPPAGEGREPIGCVERAMTHRSASRCVFATHPTWYLLSVLLGSRPFRDEIEAIRHRLPKTGPDPAKPLSPRSPCNRCQCRVPQESQGHRSSWKTALRPVKFGQNHLGKSQP